ncbi:MAG: LysM peptidoglycan-binding domain-containing protein [Chitinophagaceae bacterium]|jgi:phage tail protein X|nr:LysM peptidoglycan-binding domain-containing protein [Chitinophagaceae bacterium]
MPDGQFEKLKIFAYSDPGCETQVGEPFTVMMNPENYTQEIKMEFENGQGQGTSGSQPKFKLKPPEELSFEILFDNTGIIDKNPRSDIATDIENFKQFLMGYEGEIHQPKFFKFVWGTSLMKGICVLLNIAYKLFNPNGKPIRAICKVSIRELKEEELRVAEERNSSPDLTHYRTVKQGDTLPLMCYRIYGHSKYYWQIAKVNGLSNFRELQPGSEIFFPPIDKTTK